MMAAHHPDRRTGLDALFTPRSVAIIGASSSPQKTGHKPLRNLLRNEFPGEIFPINPTSDEILGVRVYPSITDVPQPVDLAFIVIPAEHVVAELERCAAAGVSCAIVAASGFAETDSDEGRARQERLAQIAAASGMRILGPNTNGVYHSESSLSLGYSVTHSRRLKPGGLTIVSQSGALFNAIAGQMAAQDVGLCSFVAVGNEADLSLLDVVEHCIDATDARIIAMVLESVQDGHRLRELADAARARGKLLVALKLGRSEAGARATVAHSSRLAGSVAAYRAWLADAGVPVVRTIEGIAAMAALVEHSSATVRAGGLGVFTFSGGAGALVVDIADDLSVPVPELAEATVAQLEALLTRPGHVVNPFDMGVGVPNTQTGEALTAMSSDPGVGATIVFLHGMQTLELNVVIAEGVVRAQRETGVLHVVIAPGELSDREREILAAAGIAVFADTVTCVSAIAPLLELASWTPMARVEPLPAAEALPPGVMGEREGLALLARFGVPAVEPHVVATAEEAVATAGDVGYPVVMKAIVAGLAHKAAAGLVWLALRNAADVNTAFAALRERSADLAAGDVEIILERSVKGEFEAFVGCNREPGVGLVLVAGLGGVYTEAMQQVVLWSIPVDAAQFRRRLAKSALGRMLQAFESDCPGITEQFVAVLEGVQRLVLTHREMIDALDLNPILITREGPIAVDALLVASAPE